MINSFEYCSDLFLTRDDYIQLIGLPNQITQNAFDTMFKAAEFLDVDTNE